MALQNDTPQHGYTEPKRLYRSKVDRILAGVCGGLAEYFNIDPTLVRVLWLVVLFFSGIGFGILIYLVCLIAIRDNPDQSYANKKPQNTALYWGFGLILLGLSIFSSRWAWDMWDFRPFHWHFFRPWDFWDRFWPIIIILFGVFYLVHVLRQTKASTIIEPKIIAAGDTKPEASEFTGRLFRSRDERVIAGVCGGLAKNLKVDPAIIRIGWAILTIITSFFLGVIIYIIMAIIIPEQPLVPRQSPIVVPAEEEKPALKRPRRVKKLSDQTNEKSG